MTDEPIPSTTTGRLPREIWVLVGTAFLVAIGYGLVAPALPTYARGFGVGVTAASAVISAFAFFRLGFAPVSGRLVNRLGERRVFMTGLLVVAASTGACALADTYWQLLGYRAVGGIGSTMFSVSALSMLVRIAPPAQRGRASGMWATGFLLGSVTGPLAGTALVAVSLRAPFVVYASFLVLASLVSGLLLRGSVLARPVVDDGGPSVTLREALRHPAYRAALAGSFANGWLVFGVRVALVPLFVVDALHQRPTWAGVALTMFAVGNAASLILAGRWAARRGRRAPILLGLAVSALATGSIGVVGSLPLLLAVSLVGGVGGGLVNPPLSATVADVIGGRGGGGPVLAGFQMTADLGAILGPVLAGLVVEASSFAVAFGLTGLVAVLAFVAWLCAPETLPSPGGRAAPGDSGAPIDPVGGSVGSPP
jgi:MFS family permease